MDGTPRRGTKHYEGHEGNMRNTSSLSLYFHPLFFPQKSMDARHGCRREATTDKKPPVMYRTVRYRMVIWHMDISGMLVGIIVMFIGNIVYLLLIKNKK